MPSIEMNTDYQSAIRFPGWLSLSVFSTICVIAICSKNPSDERTGETKWTLAVAVLSMVIAFLAVCAYLFVRSLFVAQTPEAAMIATVLAIWGVGLPTIMNPQKDIAVDGIEVINANLYFFSWMCFATTIFLMGSLAQEVVGIDVRHAPPKTSRWLALCASSLVVMGAAVRIYKADQYQCANEYPNHTSFCKRTKLAIAFGVLSCLFSMVMGVMSQYGLLTIMIELGTSTLLLIFWCFGVGYITFGENSPGGTIGNLYFSTWLSFIFVVFIFANNFREIVDNLTQHQDQSSGNGVGAVGDEEQIQHHDAVTPNFPELPDDDDV